MGNKWEKLPSVQFESARSARTKKGQFFLQKIHHHGDYTKKKRSSGSENLTGDGQKGATGESGPMQFKKQKRTDFSKHGFGQKRLHKFDSVALLLRSHTASIVLSLRQQHNGRQVLDDFLDRVDGKLVERVQLLPDEALLLEEVVDDHPRVFLRDFIFDVVVDVVVVAVAVAGGGDLDVVHGG